MKTTLLNDLLTSAKKYKAETKKGGFNQRITSSKPFQQLISVNLIGPVRDLLPDSNNVDPHIKPGNIHFNLQCKGTIQ